MPQPKGKTGNPAGRPKGTPNKINADLRQTVHSFLQKNMTALQSNFDQLEARDKLLFVEKLLKYTLPTLQAIDQNVTLDGITDEKIDELFNRLTSK